MPAVYLDYCSTAPPLPEVVAVVCGGLEEGWGNPASVHWAGARARAASARARIQVARLAGAAPEDLVFTSGATEANHAVLRHAVAGASEGRDTLVITAAEHASVLEGARSLEASLRVVELPVGADGRLDPDVLECTLDERVGLVSVHWVNSETGVVQPIQELARRAHARGVPLHTDAAQALGALPVDLRAAGVDFASVSAHKLGGPPGVGALYVAPGGALRGPLRGGGQEGGRRSGSENVPGIVGFGVACEIVASRPEARTRMAALRDRLWEGLQKRVGRVERNGSGDHAAPHVLNASFLGARSDVLVEALDLEEIAVSAGSACQAGSHRPSHVLRAMGLPPERVASALRLSLGPGTREDEIDHVLERLPAIVRRVRESGA